MGTYLRNEEEGTPGVKRYSGGSLGTCYAIYGGVFHDGHVDLTKEQAVGVVKALLKDPDIAKQVQRDEPED